MTKLRCSHFLSNPLRTIGHIWPKKSMFYKSSYSLTMPHNLIHVQFRVDWDQNQLHTAKIGWVRAVWIWKKSMKNIRILKILTVLKGLTRDPKSLKLPENDLKWSNSVISDREHEKMTKLRFSYFLSNPLRTIALFRAKNTMFYKSSYSLRMPHNLISTSTFNSASIETKNQLHTTKIGWVRAV